MSTLSHAPAELSDTGILDPARQGVITDRPGRLLRAASCAGWAHLTCEGDRNTVSWNLMLVSVTPAVRTLQPVSESPGGLPKHRVLCPTPRVSDSLGLGHRQRICTSSKFLGCAAGWDITL